MTTNQTTKGETTMTTTKMERVGKIITCGHYSNLSHVLLCDGKRFTASYTGNSTVNGRQMAKFDVLGITLYTSNVAMTSATAWRQTER
jgi:hypothetical protein